MAEEEILQASQPSKDELMRHMVDHSPFAAWCEDSIAARSRGVNQARAKDYDREDFELDYTFWSELATTPTGKPRSARSGSGTRPPQWSQRRKRGRGVLLC